MHPLSLTGECCEAGVTAAPVIKTTPARKKSTKKNSKTSAVTEKPILIFLAEADAPRALNIFVTQSNTSHFGRASNLSKLKVQEKSFLLLQLSCRHLQ